jgi:hypothetical protein
MHGSNNCYQREGWRKCLHDCYVIFLHSMKKLLWQELHNFPRYIVVNHFRAPGPSKYASTKRMDSFALGELQSTKLWKREPTSYLNTLWPEPFLLCALLKVHHWNKIIHRCSLLRVGIVYTSDYCLEPRSLSYISQVQLHGSQFPCWFPGNYRGHR